MNLLVYEINRLAEGSDPAYDILCCIDDLCHEGRFDEINTMLESINLASLSATAIIAILASTGFPGRDEKFPSRKEFVAKVVKHFEHREDRHALLVGLI